MEPLRTCVGCRTRREQRSLVRFTRGAEGWQADEKTRTDGRGAYVCSVECGHRIAKNKRYPGLSAAAVRLYTSKSMQ